jgi:hypothetical protein
MSTIMTPDLMNSTEICTYIHIASQSISNKNSISYFVMAASNFLYQFSFDGSFLGELIQFCLSLIYIRISIGQMPVTVAVRSEASVLAGWLLRSWVRIPLKALMFVRVFLCCVVLCR